MKSGHRSDSDGMTKRVTSAVWGRSFMDTNRKYIGFLSSNARIGDAVAVLTCGRVPIVLRPQKGINTVVDDASVHSVMHGEAMEIGVKFEMLKLH